MGAKGTEEQTTRDRYGSSCPQGIASRRSGVVTLYCSDQPEGAKTWQPRCSGWKEGRAALLTCDRARWHLRAARPRAAAEEGEAKLQRLTRAATLLLSRPCLSLDQWDRSESDADPSHDPILRVVRSPSTSPPALRIHLQRGEHLDQKRSERVIRAFQLTPTKPDQNRTL